MPESRLPVISGRDAVRSFESDGWQLVRQAGSHMIMTKHGVSVVLSIPDHRELKRGTLRGLIRSSGLNVQEFVALVDR
ncbi:MAG: type II toxin-antitoxin system HicA family toxin [SAR202 cluster bacterium]|nr:type II toxin-antitoxin system HicA family toxin [SAR202 cluster bacterium]